ncbi:MAG: phage protein D/phage baseplate assembly protein gpV [Paraglaciecola sp.]|jgi:phage protein D/phage baseplate assembly protein gpV|uniref:phage baseplate assembly protein V n=1 Tax=Polaribacter sp. TaxID=1920175 RepID=UPI003AE455E0
MANTSEKKPKDSINKLVSFDILVNGSSIGSKRMVVKINIDKTINKISRAKIYLSGGDAYKNTFDESEDTNFAPGKTVEIKIGYEQSNQVLFKGIVEKLGITLNNGFAQNPWSSLLVLECVDKAIKLTNSYTSDVYEKKKDSEIFSTLIKKIAGLKSVITATTVTHPFFPKYNSSDWDFILNRAKLNGMIVLNSDNEIKISKPTKKVSKPEQTITNGESTINFDAQIDASSQLNSISLDSWNPFTNKKNKSKAVEPTLVANKSMTGKVLSKSTSATAIDINIPQNTEIPELKSLSNSLLQDSRLGRIVGRAKFKGVTNLDIGSVVALNGFGKHFDGNIYLTGISHQVESGFFTTSIEFGLKKLQFSTNQIDKSSVIKPINGVHIGVVKKIDADPLNEGRIQVLIPALKSTGNGIWAKLSHFYISSKAGSFFIPEIDSQVVVSFISNDPRHPIVLGSLYTKANEPYTKLKKDNALKAFVSKSKLTLEFDDKDKIITISTPKENSIVISEKAKGIIITDQNKNIVKMSDKGIELTSKKNIKITSSAAVTISGSKGITLNGKAGDGVKVTGSKVNISAKTSLIAKGGSKADLVASGKVTIKGATVGIN